MRVSVFRLLPTLAFVAFAGCKLPATSSNVTTSGEWTMHGGDFGEQRFSPLKQINEENVEKLGLVWSREFGTHRGLEATPLIVDGVIYTTIEWSVVTAMHAKTGEVLWTYDPKADRTRARTIC